MRKCHFCHGDIGDAAIICPHCRKDTIAGRATAAQSTPKVERALTERLSAAAAVFAQEIKKPTPQAPPRAAIRCKTCDVGALQRKQAYRMSGIVVAIGYILLVPSVLGILASIMMAFATGKTAVDSTSGIRESAATRLRDAGIPEAFVPEVLSLQTLTDEEKRTLSPAQNLRIDSVRSTMTASQAGAGAGVAIAGGLSIFFGIVSLVGGLLGWILIMKKNILQCDNCGAAIAAS